MVGNNVIEFWQSLLTLNSVVTYPDGSRSLSSLPILGYQLVTTDKNNLRD